MGMCVWATPCGWTQGLWPQKSAEVLLHMLTTPESNAEGKDLDVNSLAFEHIQANQTPKIRGRIYRAPGRISPTEALPATCR